MGKPRVPTDLVVTNGWWVEIPAVADCHFETLDGLDDVESGSQSIIDAGTNIEYKFGDQTYKSGDLSMSRTLSNSATDAQLDSLFLRCIREGIKFSATVVKLHNGVELFRVVIVGMRFVTKKGASLNTANGEKYSVTYTATKDYAYKI
jgi:hypothetical protein